MTRVEAIQLVEGTKSASRFFGKDPKSKYHEFAKLLHPDAISLGDKLRKRAEAAFQKLGTLYSSLNGKATSAGAVTIGKWIVKEPIAKGDIGSSGPCWSDKSETFYLREIMA